MNKDIQKNTDWINTWKMISTWRKKTDERIYTILQGDSKVKQIYAEDKKGTCNVRLIVDELPTIEKLKVRKPDLYPKNQGCPRCNKEEENFQHIWTCDKNSTRIEELIPQLLQTLDEEIKENPKERKRKGKEEIDKEKKKYEEYTINEKIKENMNIIRDLIPKRWT